MKVHFNLAILEINRKNYKRALYHLDRTDEIEPNHCESSLQFVINFTVAKVVRSH
jgi:hypothetical protein